MSDTRLKWPRRTHSLGLYVLSKQPSSLHGQATAKTGARGSRAALFGVAIVLSGVALAATLTKLAVAPAPISPALASVPEDPTYGLSEEAASLQVEGEVLLTATLPALAVPLAATADVALAARQLADEKTAKLALVIELAKGALKRRLLARQAQDGGAGTNVATTGGANGPMKLASLETGIAETLPELAPTPKKRPAATRLSQAKAKANERRRSTSAKLAYATPGDPEEARGGVFSGLSKVFNKGGKAQLPGRGSGIAVYEIATATVHMPDGTKLEAHSGLGHMKDNPKYVYKKNRGPTPPNIYKLRMRERRYHGVEAIRMLPVDRSAMRGRDGMLTHTRWCAAPTAPMAASPSRTTGSSWPPLKPARSTR